MKGVSRVQAGGVRLEVRDSRGGGEPVLLIHGFPDSLELWGAQVTCLAGAGYRVVAPSLPGCGGSEQPADVAAYSLPRLLRCVLALLDALGISKAHVVGHDWGASLAWYVAMRAPERVAQLAVLSVGHAGALFGSGGMEQRQKTWYMLWFRTPPPVVERALMADDWLLFRQLFPGVTPAQQAAYIAALSRPGALTAALNLYRANVRPESYAATAPLPFPPLDLPVLGVWSSGDPALTEAQMRESARYVAPGKWRYERVEGAGHWIPRDAPDRLNALLLDFLGAPAPLGAKL